MAEKAKRPTWWKMQGHYISAARALGNTATGEAFTAALAYFQGEEPGELSAGAAVLFSMFKADIDEAVTEYEKRVQDGKNGRNKQLQADKELPF